MADFNAPASASPYGNGGAHPNDDGQRMRVLDLGSNSNGGGHDEGTGADAESFPRKKRRKLTVDERKRAVKACDGCRKVKEKCEGGQPCRRCTHLRRPCEFSELPPREPDRRDTKTRDSNNDELAIRLKYLEGILKAKSPTTALDTDSLRRQYTSLRPSPPTRRSTTNNGSTAQSDAEDADDLNEIEDENIEIRPVDHNVAHYSGEFSYWNFSMKIKKHVEDWIANPHDRKGSKDLPEYWRPSELSSAGAATVKAAIGNLPPPHIAEFLVSVFFKYAQRIYFYVDRRWLARQIDVAYNEAWSASIKDPGTVAIIFGVLAVGTQFAHMDAGTKEGHPVPNEDEVGTMFYQTATRLLPEMMQTASLESVQGVLLLALYTLTLDASGLSYVYYGLAIRLAIQNGMHRQYRGTELSAVAIETRNRVWWTACSVEKSVVLLVV
jgi:hypothetical protein